MPDVLSQPPKEKKVPNIDWHVLKHCLQLSWVILVGIPALKRDYNIDTISRSIANIELWKVGYHLS